MSSSSIEVLGVGGTEVKVMLMEDTVDDEGEDEHLDTMISPTQPLMIDHDDQTQQQPAADNTDQDFPDIGSDFHTMEGMEPPPGTIIFSPQDLLRTTKPTTRGRGRPPNRGGLSSIKVDLDGGSYGSANPNMEMPVSCEICGKVMMTGKTLVQHMAIHSDLKPFQCPHCPKSFARKVHLQGHLIVHGIEKQFECPVCHQRFTRQDCVKVHMRLHDKSKCVYCDVCHKAFLTVGALNIHLRIHRGEKPFKCHLCSKCFTQKNHLITHIKRHTKVTDEHFTKKLGPRMFKCEHCPRAFIRLSDYERHVQWNHGAVAEGSVVDKLPTVGNLLDGELKQTGLAPQIFKAPRDALNNKPRQRRARKVMCNSSTQTDEDGGRVIIPRQYQVSTSTQVSAPPTPRPADDDMYENDIFDEGMDRNYSSDEDELGTDREDKDEEKVFAVPLTTEAASDPIQDAAFDAIVQGNAPQPPQEPEPPAPDPPDQHAIFLQEVVSSVTKQGLSDQPRSPSPQPLPSRVVAPQEQDWDVEKPEPTPKKVTKVTMSSSVSGGSKVEAESIQVLEIPASAAEAVEILRPPVEKVEKKQPYGTLPRDFMPIKRGRGRARGRGRKWSPYGLTGAAELRAIRKSMMANLVKVETEEEKVDNPAEMQDDDEEEGEAGRTEEGESEGRGKRLAKNKQHGKDFVCTMKNCETCFSSPKTGVKVQPKVKVKLKEGGEGQQPLKQSYVKTLIPGTIISTSHDVTPTSVTTSDHEPATSKPDEPKMKVGNHVGSYPVDITANPVTKKLAQEDFFVTTSAAGDSVVSPPVELTSFCIPTYSCKLCNREFRFEGKLHRHIESVHQNKAIFSPDVKPGRGSSKVVGPPSHLQAPSPPQPKPPPEPENPEIAALRSEWDDDGEDEEEEEEVPQVKATPIVVETPASHPQFTIVTREIAPVTTTLTDVYSSGVKVNMNKLAGLLPHMGRQQQQEPKQTTSQQQQQQQQMPREPETIMADTLDMKCRRLLEKLFDHELLLQCGLLEEHVSVVLGRVLQHYGVKMIEDYGQGQYEVLKYNLWRLIEWKVTMEQMEEFYTAGKSVEEMMDDIMNEMVPLVSHHFVPSDQAADPGPAPAPQVTQVEAMEVGEGQVVLQQVAGVLSGHLNLADGVTQVVLSQDVSPELLQGAHIVTIDPTTGQVISQVTADQVILADSITDELEQQVAALDGQVVASQGPTASIVVTTPQVTHSQMVMASTPQHVKLETTPSTHPPQHHH